MGGAKTLKAWFELGSASPPNKEQDGPRQVTGHGRRTLSSQGSRLWEGHYKEGKGWLVRFAVVSLG